MSSINSSVLVIDDHPVVQLGLNYFFSNYRLFDEIHSAATGKEALSLLKSKQNTGNRKDYELIILDINLPDYEVTQLVESIQSIAPKSPILILTMSPPFLYIGRLTDLGIMGFLDKSVSDEEFMFAINTIRNGKKYFSGDIISDFMSQKSVEGSDILTLSARESEILSLLLKGKTIKEIGNIINLHKSSVATYKSRIYQKLKVNSLMELFQLALKRNLLEF